MSQRTEPLAIRPGQDSDVPAVIALMKTALGDGNVPRTPEFWHWKHRENPFGRSPMWLAHDGDRLVGVRLFLRWRLRAGGAEYNAVRAVDTATHPDYQGKGIFKRLTLRLLEDEERAGTQLVFNTPNAQSRPGYIKMGWSVSGRLGMWLRPLRPLRMLRAALAGTSGAEDDPTPLDEAVTPHSFEAAERTGLLGQSGGQRFHTPLDARYLDWRYRVPGIRYGSLAEQDALLVFRLRRRGPLRELRLCEAATRDGSLPGTLALRRSVQLVIRRYRPDYVIAALRPDASQLLAPALAGFLPAPALGPILTVRPLAMSKSAPDPTRLGSWSASIGDMELF